MESSQHYLKSTRKFFAYIRVSTKDQNVERQLITINELYPNKIDETFIDYCSGKNMDRPKFQELKKILRCGDTIVIESFSRISRSTSDLLKLIDEFKTQCIQLISIKERFDFDTPNGMYKGRKKIPLPRNFDLCLQKYLHKGNNYRMKQFIIETGLSREKIYRTIKEYKNEKKIQYEIFIGTEKI